MITRQEFLKALDVVNAYNKQIVKEVEKMLNEHELSKPYINLCDGGLLINTDFHVKLYDSVLFYFQMHDLKHYLTVTKETLTVNDLKRIELSRFRKLRGVGEVKIRELLWFCRINDIELLP